MFIGIGMGLGLGGGSIPVLFDLRDDFTTDLAAGSIDGTAAEPGGGTRQVIDTENKLSITGDTLSFAGQKTAAAYGDPGYWLDAVTRGLGKIVLGSLVTPSVNTKEFLVGLGVAQSGFGNDSVFYFAASNGLAVYESGAGRTVGAWATSTVYRWAIILRAAGAFYFVKGGAYGDWTLIHISHLNNTATLYPEIVNYNAVFTASTIRKPQSTYIPVPLLSDSFTRADGAIGNSDGAGNPEGGGSGIAWIGSTATIATNKAVITPTEGAEQSSGALVVGTWYRITASDADHFYTGSAINDTFRATATTALDATNKVVALSLPTMIATMTAATPNVWLDINMAALTAKTQGGIIARADSASNPQNFILAEYDGAGNIKIFDCVAGVYTQTKTVVKAFAANNRLLMRINGTKIKLWWVSGNTWTAIADDITTSVTTGNIHGMFSTAANTFDNAVIWPAGAEGQHSVLNSFFSGLTTKTFLPIGDSKTACTSGISWEWQMSNYPERLEMLELPTRIAADGWKVISPGMDTYLAAASGTPDYALINFGANDLDVTSEADYKSYYLSHLDKLKAKYPNIQCYLTKVWKRGRTASCNTMATWIDYIVSQRPTFAHVGDDERVWMENGDDGATYTADGTHPNAAGYALAAVKKRESIGL